jgi:hypothetical protein
VTTARGTFTIHLAPRLEELGGGVRRFDFTKTFTGELEGSGEGAMLSVGDPQTGAAGYVAVETVRGRLGGRQGGFALQQFGTMDAGTQTLRYEVLPGSGVGELSGIRGVFRLAIDSDGTHRYELEFDL